MPPPAVHTSWASSSRRPVPATGGSLAPRSQFSTLPPSVRSRSDSQASGAAPVQYRPSGTPRVGWAESMRNRSSEAAAPAHTGTNRPTSGSTSSGSWVERPRNSTSAPDAPPPHSQKAPKELRHTTGPGWNEPGCVVAAIAMAADVTYTQARGRAASIAGFTGSSGMTYSAARRVLSDMGVSASWHRQGGDWSSLPDRAIIAVKGSTGVAHAVVFDRDSNGSEYLYDWKYPGPVPRGATNYRLMDGDEYLDLT